MASFKNSKSKKLLLYRIQHKKKIAQNIYSNSVITQKKITQPANMKCIKQTNNLDIKQKFH